MLDAKNELSWLVLVDEDMFLESSADTIKWRIIIVSNIGGRFRQLSGFDIIWIILWQLLSDLSFLERLASYQ